MSCYLLYSHRHESNLNGATNLLNAMDHVQGEHFGPLLYNFPFPASLSVCVCVRFHLPLFVVLALISVPVELLFELPLLFDILHLVQSHMRTFSGRVMETILSLRFFIFQYGIVYKLNVQGDNTSLTVKFFFSFFFFFKLRISILSHCFGNLGSEPQRMAGVIL